MDHFKLLRNTVTWATHEEQPVTVTGPGILDVTVWQQQESITVHLVNLANPMMMKGPLRELIPLGEQKVRVRLPDGKQATNITEIDPAGYDIGWWRQHWKRTRVQGVILNAGGIARGKLLIVAGWAKGDGPAARLLKTGKHPVPQGPEALVIRRTGRQGKPVWLIAGSDDRGLMYAELDVADRIGWSTDPSAPLAEVRDIVEKPDVRERALSIYTMNRAYWESRFYNEDYWARYLDLLAKNRFDSLVVIFGYENGGFLAPCYPYFFDT